MKTTVNKINVPSDRRIIVTSDVHGHYKHLKNLLEKVNFSEEDILFIIGDIIEKGPESLKTLRYVMDISKKYTVYILMGNVDAWRLTMFEDDDAESNEELLDYIIYMK